MSWEIPPQPAPDVDSEGFWQATAQGRLALCRCVDCRLWLHPPLERCRHCAGLTAFEPVAGSGIVYSFIVQRQGAVVGYLDDLPYVVALVELDGVPGLRLPARLVDIAPEDVAIGMPVEVELVELPGGEFHVPVVRPVSSTAAGSKER
jgi:uncharacterized OB-fold protein